MRLQMYRNQGNKRRSEARPARGWFSGWLLVLLATSAAARGVAGEADAARESLQSFPQGTLEITSADGPQRFRIWIADTIARSEQGLMFVQSLPHDQGMLFPRNNGGPMTMWMKNTLIPLDMLFVDAQGEILYIRRSATPKSEAIIKLPTVMTTPAQAVLELAGGECDRRHITQGDRLRLLPSS